MKFKHRRAEQLPVLVEINVLGTLFLHEQFHVHLFVSWTSARVAAQGVHVLAAQRPEPEQAPSQCSTTSRQNSTQFINMMWLSEFQVQQHGRPGLICENKAQGSVLVFGRSSTSSTIVYSSRRFVTVVVAIVLVVGSGSCSQSCWTKQSSNHRYKQWRPGGIK